MIDVRVRQEDFDKLNKLFKATFGSKEGAHITIDSKVNQPVIMAHTSEGKLIELIKGYKPVENYLKYGYNRLIKKCPHRMFGLFNCIGEKCQLYYIKGVTGDCAHTWTAITVARSQQ